MSNTTKTKGGVARRRENAFLRLQEQLRKGTKVKTEKDGNGAKRKVLVSLDEKDKTRIEKEMGNIKAKQTLS